MPSGFLVEARRATAGLEGTALCRDWIRRRCVRRNIGAREDTFRLRLLAIHGKRGHYGVRGFVLVLVLVRLARCLR